MCGRFVLTHAPRRVQELFELEELPEFLQPRYNVAPSQLVAVIGLKPDGQRRGAVAMKWGFVPRWAKSATKGPRPINARAETVATNGTFRDSFRHRRCLIPTNGFYEWMTKDGVKTPYLFRPKPVPVAFAGIWDVWASPDAPPLHTCAVITVPANAVVKPCHDRMPAILTADQFRPWLDPRTNASELLSYLRPLPGEILEAIPVGPLVNSPNNDVPECLIQTNEAREAHPAQVGPDAFWTDSD